MLIVCTSVSYICFNISTLQQFGQVATHLTVSENLPPQATTIVQVYPAFGPGKEFHLDWMALIVARNLIATWVICGFWDWFLYFSPLQVGHWFIWEISPSP